MARPRSAAASQRKTWRTSEVNLVKGTLRQRQAEDQRRADAWLKTREAELEAVLGRMYDGMDVPGIPELLSELQKVMASYIAEFDRLYTAAYPAEFAKASIGLRLTPGGILNPKVREEVRVAATRHLLARHRNMLANIAGHATETVSEIFNARHRQCRGPGSAGSIGETQRRDAATGAARARHRDVGEIASAPRGMGFRRKCVTPAAHPD